MLEFIKNIKSSCPWLWNSIEWGNGLLLKVFYGKRIEKSIAKNVAVEGIYDYRILGQSDAGSLAEFIRRQPEGFDRFFKPYSFDKKTFKRLLGNGSYLFIGAFAGDRLVAYCFLRLFVNKSAYRGYIVDSNYQGKGISKQMGQIMTNFADDIGFRSYATISRDNIASLQSQKAGAELRVVRELPDDYLYVEIIKVKSQISVGGGRLNNLIFTMLQEGLSYAA